MAKPCGCSFTCVNCGTDLVGYYCPTHTAASQLLDACESALKCIALLTPMSIRNADPIVTEAIEKSADYADSVREELRTVIAKARGGE